ncbi:MAG: cobalamin-dependent protein [Promethearchaeota archaeon]
MSLKRVNDLIIDLDIDEIAKAVSDALKTEDGQTVLQTLCDGMLKVGEMYEEGEYYLPELVLAGETMEEALKILRPELVKVDIVSKGKVVAAIVKGDMHDIGKNIVVTLLSAVGYEVIDLGRDVPSKTIAEKAKEENADIVALSALLTMTCTEIEKVVEDLSELGIRNKVKVICGGAPLNQALTERFGADISCDDTVGGIDICNKIMAEKAS